MRSRTLFIICFCTLSFGVDKVDAEVGESIVKDALNKAKETVCRTIDGTIIDSKACDEYTKSAKAKVKEAQGGAEAVYDKGLELYHGAVEKLNTALQDGKAVFLQYLASRSESGDSPVGGAYQMVKSLKDTLTSAAGEVNTAFANLGASQSYVGDAQRWLMSVYNDFLEKLNLASGDEEFVQKDFEGHEIRGGKAREGAKEHEEPQQEGKQESEEGGKNVYESLQDAYERVSQAATMALEKAYAKVKELSKEAVKATIGEDEPLEMSSEKAQQAFGDVKHKAEDVLGKARDAAEHLVEERMRGGGQEPKELHEGEPSPVQEGDTPYDNPIVPEAPLQEDVESATSKSVETATSSRSDPSRQTKDVPEEGDKKFEESMHRPIEVL